MDAEALLRLATSLLAKHRLEVVLTGNAGDRRQGARVTIADLAFTFQDTPTNLRKLRRLADDLDAVLLRPFYPASRLYRLARDRDGIQLDFMAKLGGARSYESLRSRATPVRFGASSLLVADWQVSVLAGRRPVARETARRYRSSSKRSTSKGKPKPPRSSTLRRESDRALVDQIRRLLAMPASKRTNFLRVRLPRIGGGSAL